MDLAECKGIYVIAEQFEGKLRDVSGVGSGRILADTIGDEVGAILIGKRCKTVGTGTHYATVLINTSMTTKLEHYTTTTFEGHLRLLRKPNVFLVGATNIGH